MKRVLSVALLVTLLIAMAVPMTAFAQGRGRGCYNTGYC